MHTMNGATAPKMSRYARRVASGRPQINVTLPDKTLETIDELVKLARGESRSSVIVEAIEALARRKGVL